MTKLAIMSDLHIDINHFGDFEVKTLLKVLTKNQIDHLHIAGDISNHYFDQSLPFLKELSDHLTVTYNLGNHDMLDLDEKLINQLDFKTYSLTDKTTLLAFHGWYDYSFFPEKTISENKHFKNQFWFDRRLRRGESDPNITKQIIQKLEDKLSTLKRDDVIVSMHFVPHQDFLITYQRLKPFNAFLGSSAFHSAFQKFSIKHVVFGHNHHSFCNHMIDGVNYHSNPLGYVREWNLTHQFIAENPQLNLNHVYNPNKRLHKIKSLPEFENYYRTHLAEEFEKAMTLFELN